MGDAGYAGEGGMIVEARPTKVVDLDIETLSPQQRFAANPDLFVTMVNQLGLDRSWFYDAFRRAYERALGRDSQLSRDDFARQLGREFRIAKTVPSGSELATVRVPLLRIHAPELEGATVVAEQVTTTKSGFAWKVGFPGFGMSRSFSANLSETLMLTAIGQAGRQLVAVLAVEILEFLVYLEGHPEPIRTREVVIVDPQTEQRIETHAVDSDAPWCPDPNLSPVVWSSGDYDPNAPERYKRDLEGMHSSSVYVGVIGQGFGGRLTAEVASGRTIHIECTFPPGHTYRGEYLMDPLGLRWVLVKPAEPGQGDWVIR